MNTAKPPSGEQIQAEIDRINCALCSAELTEQQWMGLYVVRETMDWLRCNSYLTSPYESVMCGDVAKKGRLYRLRVEELSRMKRPEARKA